jgi:diaminopimelate decarboxylase
MNFKFDGCDIRELAYEYKTPLYVFSESLIRAKIEALKACFIHPYENTTVAYASKAFLNRAMIQILKETDLSLDVVSGGELFAAIDAGFEEKRIFFHGNNKSFEELDMAIEAGVGRLVVDNLHELDLLKSITRAKAKPIDILFRINPDVKGKTHDYISTGQADSKFGVALDWSIMKPVIEELKSHPWITLKGFHFHIGSQLMDHHGHEKAIKVAFSFIQRCKEELDFETPDLNIGGGFGIRYTETDNPPPIDHVLSSLMATIEAESVKIGVKRPRIIIEPGRWLVGEAGITVYTVGAIKEIPNVRNYLSVDGGMGDNLRSALYNAKYHAIIGNKADAEATTLYTVAGKCCESGDIIIRDIKLPKADYGDILVVFSTGAYHYSMSNNYNKLRRPAVVFTDKGTHRLVTKRESYEDLIKNDLG